jgi:uncharacterized protein (DUF1800 family)
MMMLRRFSMAVAAAAGMATVLTASMAHAEQVCPVSSGGVLAREGALRLLAQATFGATPALADSTSKLTAKQFIEQQFAEPVSQYPAYRTDEELVHTLPSFLCSDRVNDPTCDADFLTAESVSRRFFTNALNGRDQLRQRVAFALQQILVVSNIDMRPTYGYRRYQQLLLDNAFGNYRDVLSRVTLSPAMGRYLDMVNNDKDGPNENFARELLQLFSIGECELEPDGSLTGGACKATYDNEKVREFAYALTGWTFPVGGQNPYLKKPWTNNIYLNGSMVSVAGAHDDKPRALFTTTLPAARTPTVAFATVIDQVFSHRNVAPFVGKRLIQFLVTSNPSPAYVARVSAAFNSGAAFGIGSGQRGDMKAVLAAILLDQEARDTPSNADFGRLKEPVLLITAMLRAFNATSDGEGLGRRAGDMGQRVFYAPSVFSFYQPDNVVPNAKISGPEFGIENTNSTLARINFVYDMLFRDGINANPYVLPTGAVGTKLSLTRYEPLANDTGKLVDSMAADVLPAALSKPQRDAIVNAVNAFGTQDTLEVRRNKVRQAAYLLFSSSMFQVQR